MGSLYEINQAMKEPLYTFKSENGNIPVWNGNFLCFPTREQAIIEGKKFGATHTLAFSVHENGQWATIIEDEIEP